MFCLPTKLAVPFTALERNMLSQSVMGDHFCIHNAKSVKGTMLMWDETQGRKEVVSYFRNYITCVQKLIVSDCSLMVALVRIIWQWFSTSQL